MQIVEATHLNQQTSFRADACLISFAAPRKPGIYIRAFVGFVCVTHFICAHMYERLHPFCIQENVHTCFAIFHQPLTRNTSNRNMHRQKTEHSINRHVYQGSSMLTDTYEHAHAHAHAHAQDAYAIICIYTEMRFIMPELDLWNRHVHIQCLWFRIPGTEKLRTRSSW